MPKKRKKRKSELDNLEIEMLGWNVFTSACGVEGRAPVNMAMDMMTQTLAKEE